MRSSLRPAGSTTVTLDSLRRAAKVSGAGAAAAHSILFVVPPAIAKLVTGARHTI